MNGVILPGYRPKFGSDLLFSDLVLWSPINEKAGAGINNLINAINDGLMTGGVWEGNGVKLDGVDDQIAYTRLAEIENDWTVCMTVRPGDVSGVSPWVDQGDILIKQSADDVIYGATDSLYNDSTGTLSAALTTGSPIDIAVRRQGTTISIFADGTLQSSFTVSGTALTALTSLIIGGSSRTALQFVDSTYTNISGKMMLVDASDDIQFEVGSESLNSPVVAENWNGKQLTVWVVIESLNFTPGDGVTHGFVDNQRTGSAQNRVWIRISSGGLLAFTVADKDGTAHQYTEDVTGWAAGEKHHIVCRFDFKNDEGEMYIDGASVDNTPTVPFSDDSIDAIEATTHFASDTNGLLQLNGASFVQFFKRSFTDAEVAALWNSGDGVEPVADPDTLLLMVAGLGVEETGVVYHPFGKTVSASSNSGTETTLTTAAGTDTAFFENEDAALVDARGFGVFGKIDDTVTDTSATFDDGAGALVADAELVGVHADLNGSSEFFRATDANFPAAGITGATDLTIMATIKPIIFSGNRQIVSKNAAGGNKRMYEFHINTSGNLVFGNSSDGTSAQFKATVATGITLVLGKWVDVVVVYDASAGTADFYVNGVFIEQVGGLNTSIADKDPPFIVGAGNLGDTNFFTGGVSNLALFDDKRTPAEILISATTPNEDLSGAGNIIGQWRFNDAAAVTQIDNNEGTAGGDLDLIGGDTTNYGTHSRLTEAFLTRNHVADGGMENGGIGAWKQGDAATTHTKDTTTVFNDLQAMKVLNGDGSQAWVRQTITTVTGQDYSFHGRFFAPDTPNGASRLVDVDLAAALGITVTQANLSAGWNDVEFTFEAADTSTTIDLGSGSVTNTEAGYWDEVSILANLVPGSMEGVYEDESGGGGGTVDVAPGWNASGIETGGSDELSKETTIVHSGSASQKMVAESLEGITSEASLSLEANCYYTTSIYARGDSGGENLIFATNGFTNNFAREFALTTAFQKFSVTFTPGADVTGVLLVLLGTGGGTIYVDDIEMHREDTRAANTASRTRDFATTTFEDVAIWKRGLGDEEIQRWRQFKNGNVERT